VLHLPVVRERAAPAGGRNLLLIMWFGRRAAERGHDVRRITFGEGIE
jgi:hypothetical protein